MEQREIFINLLDSLKVEGYSRREIEDILGYSPNSLDQNASRGGTSKVIASLKLLLKYAILEKSNPNNIDFGTVKSRIDKLQKDLNDLKEVFSTENNRSSNSSAIEASQLETKRNQRQHKFDDQFSGSRAGKSHYEKTDKQKITGKQGKAKE